MRNIISIIILIFITQYTNAQINNNNNNNTFSFSILRGLTIADTVSINTKTSIKRFIIDTGAELTYLDKEFAENIKFKNTYKYVNSIDYDGFISKYPIVFIDSLKLGNTLYYNIKAVIADLSVIKNIDGIIGCNILKDYIWKFDYPNLKITRYVNLPKTPKYFVSFKYKHGIPHINLKIGNKKIRNVTFDLGSVNSISLKFKDSTLLKEEVLDIFYSKAYNKTINSPQRKLSRYKVTTFKKIHLGTGHIDSLKVGFTSRRTVGNRLFHHSILIMDFPSKKIYFDKLVRGKMSTIFGCRFKINESGEIIVSVLIENSPADKLGIKLDDILVYWKGYDSEQLIEIIKNNTIYNSNINSATIKMKNWKQEKIINKL